MYLKKSKDELFLVEIKQEHNLEFNKIFMKNWKKVSLFIFVCWFPF